MRIKHRPEDFIVVEQARLPLSQAGPYAIYKVEKRGVTSLSVQVQIAAHLNRPQSDVQVPALKDKASIATQYLSLKGTGPSQIDGDGFSAEFVGRSPRPLRPSDLTGNHFRLVLRDLTPDQATSITSRLDEIARYGLPNYFDQQRFGSYSPGYGFIGKAILERDAEASVRAYLARPFIGDPPHVREFKQVADERWGDWTGLMQVAPRPSNYRRLLTYLKDHPDDYRKALNLIPRRLLSLFLVAYQSYLWNRIAVAYLDQSLADTPCFDLTILDHRHPVYRHLPAPLQSELVEMRLALPQHRAAYPQPTLAPAVRQVLASEGLDLNDLKARILQKAYLPKSKRPLLLFPGEISPAQLEPDDRFPGRQAARVSFSLPSGSYATLVVKSLVPQDIPEHRSKPQKGKEP